ncbi:MAG: glycosyltransferase family 39 protein [Actinobacteria bacterium]|nr:glycosyltransferase family 39 protein [Actinomycetota bacterium]
MTSNNELELPGEGGAEKKKLSAEIFEFFRRYWHVLAVLLIFCAALAVRLHYLARYSEYTADSYYYMILARSLKSGAGYTVRGIAHTKYLPGYPLFILAGSYIFGGIERSAELVAVLFGSLTVLVTYGIGKELFNKWTGLTAALVVAFQPTFLKWTCLVMTEGLFTFLFSLGVYLMIVGCKRGSMPYRLIAALAGGLCLLTRWEGVLFLPFLVLMPFLYPKEAKVKWWEPYVLLVLYGGPIALYVANNIARTGRFSSYVGEFNKNNSGMDFIILKHRVKVYGWNGMSDALFSAGFYLGSAWCLIRKKYKAFLIIGGWFALFVIFHLFWYYSYERFMTPAVPAVALMMSFLLVDLATIIYKACGKDGFLASRWKGAPKPALTGFRFIGIAVLAGCLVFVMWHGIARADKIIAMDYKAFSDDHGGQGMREAADWLDENFPGETVAVNAGPFFAWEYDTGKVLYLRDVPWDLPVEKKDFEWDDVLGRLEEEGVRFIVVGETEQPFEQELDTFDIRGEDRARLKEVGRWLDYYDYPEPHEQTTVIFEILPAN